MNLKKKVDGLTVSTLLLLVGAVVLFIFSVYMWQKFVANSDKRVVWSAVESALSTDGVQVVVDDSTGETLQRATTKLDFSGDLSAETRSEYKDGAIDTVIKTVSTKTKDYLFYERNNNTKNPGLKDLEGVWVDISTEGQTESKTLADTFTNGALVLAGNMPSADRKKLIKQMKTDKLYTVLGVAKTDKSNGNEIRTYKVKLDSIAFNKALKSYFSALGLDEASSQVQLEGSDSITPTIEIAIDMSTKKVAGTGYPDISSSGARTYAEWGTKFTFELPSSTISGEELQNRIDPIYTQTQ